MIKNTNFSLAPWGSRRLRISEYVPEGVRRTGEGLLIIPIEEIIIWVFLNVQFAHFLVNRVSELVDVYLLLGRDEQTAEVVRISVLVDLSHPCALEVVE